MSRFDIYKIGLQRLLRALGQDHPRYAEALTLQSRLTENIDDARLHGDSETARAERARIIDALNRLAMETIGMSFNALCEDQGTYGGASEVEDIRGLLEAMGYRIVDSRAVGADLYFLCNVKWGVEICQEVVHFVGAEPTPSDIAALNDAVLSHDAARGVLLTREPLSDALRQLADQRERIRCYTLDAFIDSLADFRPYLERMIQEYEASEVPAFYVPLAVQVETAESQSPQFFKPLETFVDFWLSEPRRNHLSILGNSGSGKTWFCRRYAYLAARRYLDDPTHNRIPVLITLRGYSQAYDVKQLITDAVTRHHRVELAAGYETFSRLNQSGRLLIIFDGLDEMETRVSDHSMVGDNFWKLSELVCPTSKVLLTCRTVYFRDQREEERTLVPRSGGLSMAARDQLIDLQGQDRFEVAHLQGLEDVDIQLALRKRLSTEWMSVYERIQALSNLRDLASRPVLLGMIVKTLPRFEDPNQISLDNLYEAYLDTLLNRRWSEDTDYIPPEERRYLMLELAWEMHISQRFAIPFGEFPDRVREYFDLEDNPKQIRFLERDLRTQSYLVRDELGNYSFTHQSFMEYLVACKLRDALCNQHCDTQKVLDIWKMRSLSPNVQRFLLPMIEDYSLLWRLLEATRHKTIEEAKYAGANAALLLQVKGEEFANARLSHTVLINAKLLEVDLTEADLEGACLRGAYINGCCLEGVDLRSADLTESVVRDTNLEEAKLEGTRFMKAQLRDVDLTNSSGEDAIWWKAHLRNVRIGSSNMKEWRGNPYHPMKGYAAFELGTILGEQ